MAIAASPEGDVDVRGGRGDRTTWVGMAPSEDDDEDDHAHMPMGERPTYRKLRVPRQAEESAENRARRGPAPAFEGRAAALPPPPTPPRRCRARRRPTPRPGPRSLAAARAALAPAPPADLGPAHPREDIDSSPGVSFVPALEASPISPSLVSDAGAEYVALIQRVIDGGPGSQEAFDELVRHGEHALQALMAKFPAPSASIATAPASSSRGLAVRPDPRAPRHHPPPGAALRLGPRQLDGSRDPLLGDPPARRAPLRGGRDGAHPAPLRRGRRRAPHRPPLGERPRRRRPPGEPILLGLDNITRNPDHPSSHRIIAIETIAEIRSGAMVPALIAVLEGRAEDVADAARRALVIITRQDHARDVRRWHEWLSRNVARHRIEWLIDALMHEQPSLRRAAGERAQAHHQGVLRLLRRSAEEGRERAQSLYRTWWEREGKPRFS